MTCGAIFTIALSPLPAQTTYVEDSVAAGLTHSHTPGAGHASISMVGGGTVGDFNNDGLPDIFIFGGGGIQDKLFINQGNGTWQDEATQWGLTDLTYGVGSAVGDFDRDGWQDLFVTSWGDPINGPLHNDNRLYRNNGNGTFTDVAAIAGVQSASNSADSYSACFGDYDHDGWLDLFVCAYGPTSNANRLFRNNHDGTFTNVTLSALPPITQVHGLGCCFTDMDDDGWPELLLIGDTGTSRYLVNKRDGSFRNSTNTVQDFSKPNGMGVATADFDGDGDIDFYVSDIYWPLTGLGGNRLFFNDGDHNFHEAGQAAGVNISGWAWAPCATDIDNDGIVDLSCTNGWAGSWGQYPTRLYYNLGNSTFIDIAGFCGLMHYGMGRGMYILDGDRDGDEDLLLTSMAEPTTYWRNDLSNGYAWLDVDFDTYSHPLLAPHGIGTKVEAIVSGQSYVRQLDSRQSYLGQSELYLHFGLGGATMVDELRITWADGFTEVMYNLPANQRLTITAQPPFSQTSLTRGSNVDFVLNKIEPGEIARFGFSFTGVGSGLALGQLGNMRVNLLPPARVLGIAAADQTGTATLSKFLPWNAPAVMLHTQAVVVRGTGGDKSIKSNYISEQIQ
jgi:hypothetical protein